MGKRRSRREPERDWNDHATRLLDQAIERDQARKWSSDLVLAAVLRHLDVDEQAMRTADRTTDSTRIRRIVAGCLRQLVWPTMGLPLIAEFVGYRSHAAAGTAIGRFQRMPERDAILEAVRRRLCGHSPEALAGYDARRAARLAGVPR